MSCFLSYLGNQAQYSYRWEVYARLLLNHIGVDQFFLVTILYRVRDQMKNIVMIFLERRLLEFVNQ
jgi:hypothetical protein